MLGAPVKLRLVEPILRIVPAPMTGIRRDHPIGILKLIDRECKTRNQNDRTARRPAQPRQSRRIADHKLRMAQKLRPLKYRPVASEVFTAPWNLK